MTETDMKRAKILGVISALLYIASIITVVVLKWDAEIVLLIGMSVVLIPMGLLAAGAILYGLGYLFTGIWMAILGVEGDDPDHDPERMYHE